MSNLVKFEIKELPKIYVVGKEISYSMDALRSGDNRIPAHWDKCENEQIFAKLGEQAANVYSHDNIGLMRNWDSPDGDFSYICGLLMTEGAIVPKGYVSYEIKACKVALAWIKDKNAVAACGNAHVLTEQKIKEQGYSCSDMTWCMELYNCPRSTTPDENGEIIVDYCVPLNK